MNYQKRSRTAFLMWPLCLLGLIGLLLPNFMAAKVDYVPVCQQKPNKSCGRVNSHITSHVADFSTNRSPSHGNSKNLVAHQLHQLETYLEEEFDEKGTIITNPSIFIITLPNTQLVTLISSIFLSHKRLRYLSFIPPPHQA